jgi:hypothetical protein
MNSNKEYDFWYSRKQHQFISKSSKKERSWAQEFNGKLFTTAVIKGNDHGCKWDDMMFIGSGTFDNVVHVGYL